MLWSFSENPVSLECLRWWNCPKKCNPYIYVHCNCLNCVSHNPAHTVYTVGATCMVYVAFTAHCLIHHFLLSQAVYMLCEGVKKWKNNLKQWFSVCSSQHEHNSVISLSDECLSSYPTALLPATPHPSQTNTSNNCRILLSFLDMSRPTKKFLGYSCRYINQYSL